MDLIVTPVSLAKLDRPMLGAQEQVANLAARNFELARELDAARAALAGAEGREAVWADVVIGLLGRVDQLEMTVVILEAAAFGADPA